ncbi:hypothetical protein GW17_00010325 [Ensete ventricosum]|nr:hypothetical protein GW17_00010325 [Ensete ventricosum]RZR83454.1 hypothetical protein BHM03_00010074 [Ensete ventricosum]
MKHPFPGEREVGQMIGNQKLEHGSIRPWWGVGGLYTSGFGRGVLDLELRVLLSAIDMDALDSVVDPLREFAKDSVRLVKRCHKPDRKGKTLHLSCQIVSPLDSVDLLDRMLPVSCIFVFIPKTCAFRFDRPGRDCRVLEGGDPHGDRVRGDGIRRFLRQADLYSDQQHHCRLRLGNWI